MDREVKYRFVISYPWKKMLRNVDLSVIVIVFLVLAYDTYYYFYLYPQYNKTSWITDILLGVGIGICLILLFRYVSIKLDKIKAPIEVMVTEDKVYWVKGSKKLEMYLTNIKDAYIFVNDKKAMIDVNYREMVGTSQGWRLQFRRRDEFSSNEEYQRFVREVFPKLKEVVKTQMTKLNPGVEIRDEDRRRKYR